MSDQKISDLAAAESLAAGDSFEIVQGGASKKIGALLATQLASYTVATVPDAATYPRCLIFVSNESGGAQPAFSDGTSWRRLTDRANIT